MDTWKTNKGLPWEVAPFLRLLPPLVVGIVAYYGWGWNHWGILQWWVVPVPVALAVLLLLYRRARSVLPWLSFAALSLCIGITGYALAYFQDVRHDPLWFGHSPNRPALACVTDQPVRRPHSWRIPVRILATLDSPHTYPARGEALLYLAADTTYPVLHRGDTLLLPPLWQPIRNAGNPFEMDYAGYCRRNNLYYRMYCKSADVQVYGRSGPGSGSLTTRTHDYAMGVFARYITDSAAATLVQAMLLGDEARLDEGLIQQWSETGIVHVIAISGGNVAIFFAVITFLLRRPAKRYPWLRYALAIPLMWWYVLVAGAEPSAVRAVILFTLVGMGVLLQRPAHWLNLLAATAFLLLVARPAWLYAVGFQLSIVAVLSIMLFHRPIYRLWTPPNGVLKFVWEALVASAAAEVLVAPLVVYYFHNFPLVSLPANVLAALFMGLVQCLGMALVAVAWQPWLAQLVGMSIRWLVWIFNPMVAIMQRCNPPALLHLRINGAELLILYVAIACLAAALLRHWKPGLFLSLAALCLCVLLCSMDAVRDLLQDRLVVYNSGRHTVAERIRGNYFMPLHDAPNDYVQKPAHTAWQAWQRGAPLPNPGRIHGKTYLALDSMIDCDTTFPVDVLVLAGNFAADATELERMFHPGTIVLGAGARLRAPGPAQRLRYTPHYLVRLKGAFICQ